MKGNGGKKGRGDREDAIGYRVDTRACRFWARNGPTLPREAGFTRIQFTEKDFYVSFLFFFLLPFLPPFLPRFFAFCFLRSSFVFFFLFFFCVSSYREGILVKYQMRHFYRGFIASTSDKFLGIKVENPRCTRLRILSDLIGWMCLVPSYRS